MSTDSPFVVYLDPEIEVARFRFREDADAWAASGVAFFPPELKVEEEK